MSDGLGDAFWFLRGERPSFHVCEHLGDWILYDLGTGILLPVVAAVGRVLGAVEVGLEWEFAEGMVRDEGLDVDDLAEELMDLHLLGLFQQEWAGQWWEKLGEDGASGVKGEGMDSRQGLSAAGLESVREEVHEALAATCSGCWARLVCSDSRSWDTVRPDGSIVAPRKYGCDQLRRGFERQLWVDREALIWGGWVVGSGRLTSSLRGHIEAAKCRVDRSASGNWGRRNGQNQYTIGRPSGPWS